MHTSVFVFYFLILFASKLYALNYLTNNPRNLIKTILRHTNKQNFINNKISQILYKNYKYKKFEYAYE